MMIKQYLITKYKTEPMQKIRNISKRYS